MSPPNKPLVWLTRSESDSQRLAQRLNKRGINSVTVPLFTIKPVANLEAKTGQDKTLANQLDAALAQSEAVIFTSSNAISAFCGLTKTRPPAFTVGSVSGEFARKQGFTSVEVADGNVASLTALVKKRLIIKPAKNLTPKNRTPKNRTTSRLFYPAAKHTAANIAKMLPEFEITQMVVYEAVATKRLPPALINQLKQITHLVLYSPRTARIFKTLTAKLDTTHLIALCLSKAVSDELKTTPLANILTAEDPLDLI